MKIEINGIAYEQMPPQQPKKIPKSLSTILMMSAALQITNPYATNKARSKPLPTNDIVKEFELIQLKKSKLSRSERERVVAVFNKNFRRITT